MRASRALTLGCVLLLGCPNNGDGPEEGPLTFTCDPDADPSASTLRRLTRVQLDNTIADLAASFGDDALAARIGSATATARSRIPYDAEDLDYDQLDDNVTQGHVDAWYDLAYAFGGAATADSASRTAVAGSCATDGDSGNDDACIEAFLRDFGLKALRRPITDEEVAFFRDEVMSGRIDQNALADAITVLLAHPSFIYHLEADGEPVDGRDDLVTLGDYELASRLSFHFWQTMPDDELLAAAADGELRDEAGYQAQVDRLFADPRTHESVRDFFHQWLELEEVPPMHLLNGDPAFDAFAGANSPSTDLRRAMQEDVENLVHHHTFEAGGTLDDLFVSDLNFSPTAEVAALYGDVGVYVPGTDPAPLGDSTRIGVLTRPAMVAAGAVTTRPVMKGKFVRERILCDSIGSPPDDLGDLPEVDPLSSTREQLELLTMREDTSCIGCHRYLNGIGFTTENFDALGRLRTEEVVFDMVTGEELARVPIDTVSQPYADFDDEREATDGVDMSYYVVETGKHHACFARHYFRFSHGRLEDLGADGCALEAIRQEVAGGAPLATALKNVALDPSFKLRKH